MQVRAEMRLLHLEPISGSPSATIRRNRLRVLSQVEINLINRQTQLLLELSNSDDDSQPDPADFWKDDE